MKTKTQEQIDILRANIRSSLERAYDSAGDIFCDRDISLYGPKHTYPMYEQNKLMLTGLRLQYNLEAFSKDPEKFEKEIKHYRKELSKNWNKICALEIK